MAPTIDIIRHAEAYHNLFGPHVRDPGITPIGGEQGCASLRKKYPHADDVIFIISSPMRRCIETALRGIAPLLDEGQGIVSLLPDLQEVNASPSGTGSPLSKLVDTYGENLEKETVPEDWYVKGPDTKNAPDPDKVEVRAWRARQSIRRATRIAARHHPDAHVVVVTHGEFAHWLTQDFAGITNNRNSAWWPAEFRSYRFADLQYTGDDDDATLVEIDTPESLERRENYLPAADTEERKALQKQIAVLHVQGHARMAEMWAGQELEEDA
ncbi:phosphoglycerate mutase-like protein [Hypoxylon rubiginosum]|uniref:Phosphoglycerate mutase-like protein n=1 Tax=Hypoxylon rubiginosum TaxID=110542 RepID=A0ACB9ZBY0_9PEZI|nr:phosphoglycerate mutase-like protein [Hypoxylon rubiginosum]